MNASDIDLKLCGPDERRAMGMAANAAFLKLCADDPEYLPDMLKLPGMTKTRVMEEWRHAQVRYITERRAGCLSEVTQRDCGEVIGRFAAMADQPVTAFRIFVRQGKAPGRAGDDGDAQNALRQWRHKCTTEGPAMGYNTQWMRGYLAKVFHATLDTATAAQLKALYVTMRSRYLKKKSLRGVEP